MRDLRKQEEFEIEVLSQLNSGRFLNHLVFTGGTMLRLCHGLNRFSVDLDFWIDGNTDPDQLFEGLKGYLGRFYTLKDSAVKFYTLIFELATRAYPRGLKIEIRKERKNPETEWRIAYSKYSTIQVLLQVASLKEMMKAKIKALLERKEIRDAFDIEFLLRRGVEIGATPQTLGKMLRTMDSFTTKDYTVKLGSLLEEPERRYYTSENFGLLRREIQRLLENKGIKPRP